ncbi:MAG: YqgE/AlgH family protein [Gammaproteobacteria bacterium]|nr:YqgE/AlgH family protein [Gammaproteobacteria bacterium]
MDVDSKLSNHFLIAMPALADPDFFHSVTYLCEHNEEGAMGIVVNRPHEFQLGELFRQLEITPEDPALTKLTVYHGGPVQPESGFVLHELTDDQWEATMSTSDGLGLTASKDIIEAIAHGKGPKNYLIALGYAGWGAGQLEEEIKQNTWLSGPATDNVIFDTPISQRWEAAASLIGVDLSLISNEAGHA